ncbi:MAG: MBL fold metallo-hydrolase [Burkholderiales bacterium]
MSIPGTTRRIRTASLGLALVVAVGAGTPPARGYTFETVEVAPGVHAFVRPDPLVDADGNVTLIVNDEDAVVVDANATRGSTRAIVEAIRRITDKPVRLVVNTHWHDDHVMGNQAYRDVWPGVTILAHPATRRDFAARGPGNLEGFRTEAPSILARLRAAAARGTRRDGAVYAPHERARLDRQIALFEEIVPDLPATRIVLPDVTLDGALVLHRGARTIEIRPSPTRAHTSGDLFVWLPAERVLIAGDLVIAPVPFALTSFVGSWAGALREVMRLGPVAIVPGHGPVMREPAYVDRMIALFEDVDARAKDAVRRGLTLEQAKSAIDLADWRERWGRGDGALAETFRTFFEIPAVERSWREAAGTLGTD